MRADLESLEKQVSRYAQLGMPTMAIPVTQASRLMMMARDYEFVLKQIAEHWDDESILGGVAQEALDRWK